METTNTTTSTVNQSTDFIWTAATHNYISRAAVFEGSDQIEFRGRSVVRDGVSIRGDLAWVRIGRYTHLSNKCSVEPPILPNYNPHPSLERSTTTVQSVKYIPVTIGTHTWIGTNVRSQAAAIGSYCWVGDAVTIGPRVIIKDACIIEAGVHLPADMMVPPFTRVMPGPRLAAGCTNVVGDDDNETRNRHRLECQELSPSIIVEIQDRTRQYYHDFASNRTPSQVLHPSRLRE